MVGNVRIAPNTLTRIGVSEGRTCPHTNQQMQLLEDDVRELQRIHDVARGFSLKAVRAREDERAEEAEGQVDELVLEDAHDTSSQATTAPESLTEPAPPPGPSGMPSTPYLLSA